MWANGFPEASFPDVQVFQGLTTGTSGGAFQWVKRPGAAMVYFDVIAAGGAGGSGITAGGGGGGGGGRTMLFCHANNLPDSLFVSPGRGGVGSSAAGVAGGPSYVSISETTNVSGVVAYALGGAGGTTVGNAGAGGAIATSSGMRMGQGISRFFVGQAGSSGASFGAGQAGNVTIDSSGITGTMGGCGGGGGGTSTAASSGGVIIGAGSWISITSPTTDNMHGSGGISSSGYKKFYGGTGGRGANIAVGRVGDGGCGGVGCGGGGAAYSVTTTDCGIGGNGGPGQITIIQW